MFKISQKLAALPPYLFLEIDQAKRKARAEGKDIIDLGVGDPDLPTPAHIIKALSQAAQDPATHRYALDQGMPALRRTIAGWYKRRFKVNLDPDKEILPLIGSKEGIAHFPLAFLNKGDYSLIPDPCYPPYKGGAILAAGVPYLLPLRQSEGFLPDLKKIPAGILKKSKILYLNYPNNPTSAVAGIDFYSRAASFARKNRIIVVSDLAYSEIAFDGFQPRSFLEVEGAKDIAIEFHSLSKTYNMTGWRLGWACGNAKLIAALGKVKSNIDSGVFSAVQLAGIAALEGPQEHIAKACLTYRRRRDALFNGLNQLGWRNLLPQATFYAWLKIPNKESSIEFSGRLLKSANIVVTPGVGFGKSGEGYIRIALTVDIQRIEEALQRLKKIL